MQHICNKHALYLRYTCDSHAAIHVWPGTWLDDCARRISQRQLLAASLARFGLVLVTFARVRACVRACLHACARATVRARVRACVRALPCVRACVALRACVACTACVCVRVHLSMLTPCCVACTLWPRHQNWARFTLVLACVYRMAYLIIKPPLLAGAFCLTLVHT